MAVDVEEISELIEAAEDLTWPKIGGNHGHVEILSVPWLVWIDRVHDLSGRLDKSIIQRLIVEGSTTELVGYDNNRFEHAKKQILTGLEAELVKAQRRTIPASDREVTLGHNSPEKSQAIEQLDKLIKAVDEANDFPGDQEVKEQVIAELSAGRRLLEAAKVRATAFSHAVQPALKWMAEKAGGAVIGKMAGDLWQYLHTLHFW